MISVGKKFLFWIGGRGNGRLREVVAHGSSTVSVFFKSRVNAHVYPFLRTAKSVAEILAYYFSRVLLGYIYNTFIISNRK